MKGQCLTFAFFIGIVCFSDGRAQTPSPPSSGSQNGQITGTLKCKLSGQAWADNFVYLAGESFVALTDSDGHFTLRSVPAGTYRLKTRDDESIVSLADVMVDRAQVTDLGDIPVECGLLAHYPFEGDVTDVSGNGRDGTTPHGPLTYVSGPIGLAAQLDGVDDFILLDQLNFHPELSVSFWATFYVASFFTHAWSALCGPDGRGGINFEMFDTGIHAEYGNSCDRFPPEWGEVFYTTPFQVGTWFHIAFVYSAGEYFRVYIDGNRVAEDVTRAPSSYVPNVQYMGTNPFSGGTSALWKGATDELRIYRRALSDVEITILFLEGQP